MLISLWAELNEIASASLAFAMRSNAEAFLCGKVLGTAMCDAGMRVWPLPDAAQTFYFRDRGGGGILIAGNLEGTGAVKRGEGQNERATVPTVVGQPWAVDVRQKHQTDWRGNGRVLAICAVL